MKKILTVVVPTYNEEKYLRDNLESFKIDKLMMAVEVLVVIDGSTDSSLSIAREYEKNYPDCYRVIEKENGGHGSCINCGIENASGDYFKVVDADDWVDKNAFISLVDELRKSPADIVYSGFLWAYDCGKEDKTAFKTKAEVKEPFKGVKYHKTYKLDAIASRLYMKMHNITIKTQILRDNKIRIDEHCYYVDTEYITYPIPYVKTISFIDRFVYYYRIGREGQSVSIEKMQKNESNYDKVIKSLLGFYKKLGSTIFCSEEKKNYIAGIIARTLAGKIKIILSYRASRKRRAELIRIDQRIKKNYPEIYYQNKNKALSLLRISKYRLYFPASHLARWMFVKE